jgi:RNA polymerase sigma-70 factor (ECF subfamily)
MDEYYIQKVLDGDADSFRFIINTYKDMAFSMAMSVVKDDLIAREVLQTSFVQAYINLSSFKHNSKFSTWLYRIVINEAFKVKKRAGRNFIIFGNLSVFNKSESDDFTMKIDEDEQKYYINKAMKMLSSKESLVLRLFYLEDNSIDDITDITGWTNSNIKVILHRARINMSRILITSFKLDPKSLYI